MKQISLDGGFSTFSYDFETKEELNSLLAQLKSTGFETLAYSLAVKHRDVLKEHSEDIEVQLSQKEVDLIYYLSGVTSGKTALSIMEKLDNVVSDEVHENPDIVHYNVSSDLIEGLSLKVQGF